MSSHLGRVLRLTSFGESHGKSVGGILDGCPPNVALTEADLQPQLNRRRPGQSALTTDREEADTVTIVSGVEDGRTLGTPIAFYVANRDQVPGDYERFRTTPPAVSCRFYLPGKIRHAIHQWRRQGQRQGNHRTRGRRRHRRTDPHGTCRRGNCRLGKCRRQSPGHPISTCCSIFPGLKSIRTWFAAPTRKLQRR